MDAEVFRDLSDRGLCVPVQYNADDVVAELFRVGAGHGDYPFRLACEQAKSCVTSPCISHCTVAEHLEPAILFGAVAAILLHQQSLFERAYRVLGHIVAAALLLLATMATVLSEMPSIFVHVGMVLLVVALCVRENTVLHTILIVRLLGVVGAISYGMYLM